MCLRCPSKLKHVIVNVKLTALTNNEKGRKNKETKMAGRKSQKDRLQEQPRGKHARRKVRLQDAASQLHFEL